MHGELYGQLVTYRLFLLTPGPASVVISEGWGHGNEYYVLVNGSKGLRSCHTSEGETPILGCR
jgi:hypothetical protein